MDKITPEEALKIDDDDDGKNLEQSEKNHQPFILKE